MSSENSIGLNITPEQIIDAIKRMKREERSSLIEDILASSSPEYLISVREAREDYKKRRVYSLEQVFKNK